MKVLNYESISQIHALTSKLYHWHKSLWGTNRKLYNKLKHLKSDIYDLYQSTYYNAISGNEMTVEKGIRVLGELKSLTIIIDFEYTDSLIEELREKAEVLLVTIQMMEHENSVFDNLMP